MSTDDGGRERRGFCAVWDGGSGDVPRRHWSGAGRRRRRATPCAPPRSPSARGGVPRSLPRAASSSRDRDLEGGRAAARVLGLSAPRGRAREGARATTAGVRGARVYAGRGGRRSGGGGQGIWVGDFRCREGCGVRLGEEGGDEEVRSGETDPWRVDVCVCRFVGRPPAAAAAALLGFRGPFAGPTRKMSFLPPWILG